MGDEAGTKRGGLLWNGEFTRPIFMCARWGDFWERRSFSAHMLVKYVTEHSGEPSIAFPPHGVAAGLFTIQAQGPLLRVTWALDGHSSVKRPALTYLTPDGIIHFGYRDLVQVSQGRDPHRLPLYALESPSELLQQGLILLRRELDARLQWYSNGGAELLSLPPAVKDGGGGGSSSGADALEELVGGQLRDTLPTGATGNLPGDQAEEWDGREQGVLEGGEGEEQGSGDGLRASGARAVSVRLRAGREKPEAPRRQFRREVDHLGAAPYVIDI